MTRTALRSMVPIYRRLQQRFVNGLYVIYAWSMFIPLASLSWLVVILLPRLKWRWWAIHHIARFLMFASGTKVTVNGLENLPPESQISVFVANHSSYLDSFAVLARVPRDFSFVSKGEFKNNMFAGPALKRLHAEFVERFDMEKGVSDALNIASNKQRTQSLFFSLKGLLPASLDYKIFAWGRLLQQQKQICRLCQLQSVVRVLFYEQKHGCHAVVELPLLLVRQ